MLYKRERPRAYSGRGMVGIRDWCRIGVLACGVAAGLSMAGGHAALAQDAPAAREQPFDAWLQDLRTEALAKGIAQETLDTALADVALIPRVIELDRKQPEFTQTYTDYLAARVTEARITLGRKKVAEHLDELRAVSEKYHVQPRFIAAIWGMETNYGSYMGNYSVIASLATLAYDTRRSTFFRKELLEALEILDEGHTTADAMKGSWAGAMGQSQFMPSSFLEYAQDFDGDGRRDIWGTTVDVFASIANYLAVHGWTDDHTWGRQVVLPTGFEAEREKLMPEKPPAACSRALKVHTMAIPLPNWEALGVRGENGQALPNQPALKASLVTMDDGKGPSYLTYPNFRAILSYNCSNFYALAVGHLADELEEATRPVTARDEANEAHTVKQ